ncbi:MAG: chitobiase/beta-hexosaminidase C-terminal domain-containing protein [Deltaproteobacteria bacterium]|nr:chitobiase/beta-hexosaminidase C-terminal domain-containing protein [Deltaproteobacteria bacterium]MBN2671825.1 chitobiase/beta-hexosaminidase C-terminal domain-containing protein [Deltaproteobacteria bacterium]
MKQNVNRRGVFFIIIVLGAFASGCGENGDVGPRESNEIDSDGNPIPTGAVAAPELSVPSGEVPVLTEIGITCATSGSTAYYTTDGTTPTSASIAANSQAATVYETLQLSAICVGSQGSSSVVTAGYTGTPLHPEFVFELASGHRWDYHYTWSHWVGYSMSGDSSFSVDKDFSLILGEPIEVNGITAYEVHVIGDHNVKWAYLAADGYRLLGSEDGQHFTVLFDAMFGYWAGDSFFIDFNGAGDTADNYLSATFLGDTATISDGWYFSDDDSAYYPGIGTISDPDAWSSHSNKEETYKVGVGPSGYTFSSGSSDAYEASSDTYTVTLTSFATGTDYTMFHTDLTIAPADVAIGSLNEGTCRILVEPAGDYIHYLVYVEFLDNALDPVISIVDIDFNTVVQDWNDRSEAKEFYKTDSLNGGLYLTVSDFNGQAMGDFRVSVVPIGDPDDDDSLEPYTYIPSSVANCSSLFPLYDVKTISGSLEVDTYDCMYPSLNTSSQYYFFAIPTTEELDMAIALVDTPAAETSYWYRIVNENAAGRAEAFRYTPSVTPLVVDIFDTNWTPAGTYLAGWGLY